LERWQQVHDLLGKGAGQLKCARSPASGRARAADRKSAVLRAVGVPCLAVRWSSGVPGVLMMVVPRPRRPVAGLRSKGGERRGLRVHRIA